ncbi:Oxidoreductase molybdopterin binding domain/Mo-co oxidoreductase dimerisation domain containing protein, putative [Angomonas deanei]|uniref:Oxidoreductase molybdopterin binding domain/Mo-co oxidoreductase dimerisation domain containing protein, putative n=1 Tax=Angomonas deanei TaxID=59799 RepID=A0A7G2CQX1_9TRYP|nr:Oxidoreductase molybdopterin binding domain/Mo-co oxidoreductase dimerisation domain containing protein, putative [Angomonas deanei]
MLAAGSGIDKWWKIFNIHDEDAVRDILERHRIGNLKGYKPLPEVSNDAMWVNEPKRSPGLLVLNSRPFNAQSPEGVMDEFITPNDLFFVRGHMPVPDLTNKPDFCVQVEGDGIISHCFTLDELRSRFQQHTVTTTMQCGGNRRKTMQSEFSHTGKGVKGLEWSSGGIGTASWTGVWLREVLAACRQSEPENKDTYHVQFEGADHDAAGHFQVSIPYKMATHEDADVLLAYKMNGEDIPRDHGYPLRAIVPGVVGVRNCKFLQRVTVQPFEAQSVWQQNDYKNFPSWETKPDPSYPSVYYMPVQSCLTDATYNPGEDSIDLKAYAYAGGGKAIQRVEVSFDGGETFERTANLLPPPPSHASPQVERSLPNEKAWAWRQVDAQTPVEDIKATPVELEDGTKVYNTCIRAITTDNATQPKVGSYNFRGLLYNGYSCREVKVE